MLYLPEYFETAFYIAAGLYFLQIGYYIVLFERRYAIYRRRLDNFFADDEQRRLSWVRRAFYMASAVGIAALLSTFVSLGLYMAFTVLYSIFYIYFAIKYIDYVNLFHRFAPAFVNAPENDGKANGMGNIAPALEKWIAGRHYTGEGITLDSLSQELNTNQTYLSRYINTQKGLSFKAWISSLRIGEAQRILAEQPEIPVSQIGEMVGIASRSSFFRQFLNVTGTTPGEYREHSCRKL